MKKKALYTALAFILLLIIFNIHAAKSLNIKVLGDISGSKSLFDNIIDKKNYTEFEYKKGRDPGCILSLDNHRYIKKIMIYYIKDYSPKNTIIEFSPDLFHWNKAEPKKRFKKIDSNIRMVEYSIYNKAARFIRLIFQNNDKKDIRISEIKIEINDKLKVNKAELKVLNRYEHSVKLKLRTDIEAMSLFKYGLSLNSLHDGPVLVNYSTENVVNITGLLKGTEYYIIGIAKDCNENVKYSSPIKVKTKGIPLPLITRIKAGNIKHDSFILDFTGNIETKYDIYFGYSGKSLKKKKYLNFNKDHRIEFKDLKPETLFYYKIEIIDKFNNKKRSKLLNVKLLPENIGAKSEITGDFKYTGESLGPKLEKGSGCRLVDWDFSYMNGSVMSGNINSKDQKLIFDLKKVIPVKKIEFIWWALIYSTDFKVEISRDNKKWVMIKKHAGIDKKIKYDFSVGSPYVVSRIKVNKKCRYIRATCKKRKYTSKFPQYVNLRLLEVIIIPDTIKKLQIKPVLIR